jgi:hypothetical protein
MVARGVSADTARYSRKGAYRPWVGEVEREVPTRRKFFSERPAVVAAENVVIEFLFVDPKDNTSRWIREAILHCGILAASDRAVRSEMGHQLKCSG